MWMRFGWHSVAQLAFAVIGCGGASSGDSSGGSSGSSSGGGGAVVPTVVFPPCEAGILYSYSGPKEDPRVRETHSGSNGEFTDTCQNGELVQYACELMTTTGPPQDPVTWTSGTGRVVSRNIDCDGRCVNGACPNACPANGDRLLCLSVDADDRTTLESASSGWTYVCDISPASCETMPQPGETVDVTSTQELLLTGDECVAVLGFSVGTGVQPSCWYYPCTATPP